MLQQLEVPASVTVRSAVEFSDALLKLVEAGDDVELDLAQLAEVDLSFVQILCAAREQLARAGRTLRLAAPAAQPLTGLLERAGFLADPGPADLEFWFQGELPQ